MKYLRDKLKLVLDLQLCHVFRHLNNVFTEMYANLKYIYKYYPLMR